MRVRLGLAVTLFHGATARHAALLGAFAILVASGLAKTAPRLAKTEHGAALRALAVAGTYGAQSLFQSTEAPLAAALRLLARRGGGDALAIFLGARSEASAAGRGLAPGCRDHALSLLGLTLSFFATDLGLLAIPRLGNAHIGRSELRRAEPSSLARRLSSTIAVVEHTATFMKPAAPTALAGLRTLTLCILFGLAIGRAAMAEPLLFADLHGRAVLRGALPCHQPDTEHRQGQNQGRGVAPECF